MKLKAYLMYRHNGGIAIKRQWGSSTVTEFWVYKDEKTPNESMVKIQAYGKTPGKRKTYALKQAELILNGSQPTVI
jgi:hypothetical protein